MSVTSDYTSCFSKSSYNSSAVTALKNNLEQSLLNLKDLGIELELLYINSENYRAQFIEQKKKCQSISCQSSETLKKVIESKNKIIQLAASTLTEFNETQNFGIINKLFEFLCGKTPKSSPVKENCVNVKHEPESLVYTQEKELSTSATDLSIKDESSLEIEGTPGRVSPIIPPRKLPAPTNNPSERDKKKCPGNWSAPETKTIKLSYPSPAKGKTRLKQSRLNLIKAKPRNTVDITSSPEFSGGCRVIQNGNIGCVQPLIKKESIEDDTILPSPTSGPTNFTNLYKTTCKNSPIKLKIPLTLSPVAMENDLDNSKCDIENKDASAADMEESIKLLQPNRHKNDLKRKSPKKSQKCDEDATHCQTLCEGNDSISLLQHVKILEANKQEDNKQLCSPTKRPLEENKNITNIQEDDIHIDSSMSLLSRELKPNKVSPTNDKVKGRVQEPVEPVYKEPTVRKKAEKRALPGWNCDQCKLFYDELYKDNPEMLAKKMDECSKHRGRNNPQRPRTPEGFWNPRWDVPDDTEEFNRRNNAV